ncbi:MAG TPA: hypothetical protein VGP72_25240 [Planctomycetota bacterium]|jgi:hypothetical protein
MVASLAYNAQSPVIGEQTPVRVCETVAEETTSRLAAYRREKEKFGQHPVWRRVTGLTFDFEARATAKQRRWGLRQLVKWIKGRASDERRSNADAPSPLTPLPRGGEGDRKRISLTQKWEREPEEWARAKKCGMQVEEICARLQISSTRLSALVREACGVSASELIDGFKIERVRKGLFERLRDLARELWGVPGYMVYEKLGPHGRTETESQNSKVKSQKKRNEEAAGTDVLRDGDADRECKADPSPCVRFAHVGPLPRGGEGKRPQYFRVRNAEWRTEDEIEERERRTKELLKKMRAECNLEVMALELGFANGSRMKRACLNVLGKSWRAIERELVEEVVRYYLCAEDKLLREIASREDSILTFCARELYDGTEEKPEAPFLDNWSLQERFARDWLMRMAEAFG